MSHLNHGSSRTYWGLIRQLLVLRRNVGLFAVRIGMMGLVFGIDARMCKLNIYIEYLPSIIYRYTYVQLYIITSTLSKVTYTFQKSTDIAFQEYATLPQFHGGETSGLQRTAVTRVRLLDYENYRTPLGKNPWDFCRFSHENQSTMNKEQLMIDGEASLNPIWNRSLHILAG